MQISELVTKENDVTRTRVKSIPVNLLKPSRYQVRDFAFFDKEDLENLASSMRSIGLLQYPKVRNSPEDLDYFEIISGHRRIRAASEILGWKEINCEICECNDESRVFQLSLEENIQRRNLSSYEEGIAFLLSEKMFGLSQDQVAERFHQSRATVQSKRQLALSANSYLKHTESTYANAFLRHVTIGHIESLSKIDPNNVKHALKMIARGAAPRHVERFANLFGKANGERLQSACENHKEGTVTKIAESAARNGSNQERAESRLLQDLDELMYELPSQMKPKLVEIRRTFLDVIKRDNILNDRLEDKHGSLICCPKCGNRFTRS